MNELQENHTTQTKQIDDTDNINNTKHIDNSDSIDTPISIKKTTSTDNIDGINDINDINDKGNQIASAKNNENENLLVLIYHKIRTFIEYYFFYFIDILFSRNHIDNVLPNLYIGNIYTALNKDILTKNNIDVIINCSTDIPFIKLDSIKMTYRFPIDDDLSEKHIDNMAQNIDKYVDIIRTHIKNNHNVYVHCRAGIQRSPSVIIGYLIKYNDMDLTQAIHYLRSVRNGVFRPENHFYKSLKSYELSIR